MSGWELTAFGDRPALRRELRGLNADGPADDLGAEILQLDEGEVCYWRIDDRGRHRMSGTRYEIDAIITASREFRATVAPTQAMSRGEAQHIARYLAAVRSGEES